MFRSKSELQEARIADLKEAHDARVKELMRLVVTLTEQIEYLREQLHPRPPHPAAGWAGDVPAERPTPHSLSEEEEQILALREYGHLDGAEANDALQLLAEHGITGITGAQSD